MRIVQWFARFAFVVLYGKTFSYSMYWGFSAEISEDVVKTLLEKHLSKQIFVV